jgi:hypothetical protein
MQKRARFFIDKEVQGALAFRVAYYWSLTLLGMFLLLAAFPIAYTWWNASLSFTQAWQMVAQTWLSFCYPMVASALLVPFLIWDVIRLSHRHVGPVYRLRNALRDLGDGKTIHSLHFREGDMWQDLADQLNRVATRLQDENCQQDRSHDAVDDTADQQPVVI